MAKAARGGVGRFALTGHMPIQQQDYAHKNVPQPLSFIWTTLQTLAYRSAHPSQIFTTTLSQCIAHSTAAEDILHMMLSVRACRYVHPRHHYMQIITVEDVSVPVHLKHTFMLTTRKEAALHFVLLASTLPPTQLISTLTTQHGVALLSVPTLKISTISSIRPTHQFAHVF